jgi:hypothetical protein
MIGQTKQLTEPPVDISEGTFHHPFESPLLPLSDESVQPAAAGDADLVNPITTQKVIADANPGARAGKIDEQLSIPIATVLDIESAGAEKGLSSDKG